MNYRPFPLQFSNKGLSFSEMDNFHTLCINDSTRLLINMLLFPLYLPVPSLENSLMVKKKKITYFSKDISTFWWECNILII